MEQSNNRRGQRNDKPEDNIGNGQQFSGEALDIASRFQKLQNSVILYKKKNEALEKEKGELINKLHELSVKNDQLQTSYNELTTRFDSEKRRWQQRANDSDLEIQALKKKLIELKDEASRYQSALGEATNVRFGDDDSNNQVQLSKAIIEMQNLLMDFTTVKGKDITIDEKAVSELLTLYKCKTRGKPVISAALQRKSEITIHMISLCNLINRLGETRNGTDEITRVTPVKVRQQVYAVLGSRGFCKDNHPIIEKLASYILENIGKYRKISDEKQLEFQYKAIEVVKKFAHLYFRLNAQEPIPSYSRYFDAGNPLQNNVMDGSWDDDNMDNLEVEICSFPLIYIQGKNNSKKILSKAIVLPREKEQC
ncbi:12799_t:CDS:2 [Gigaspora margarita]|uniref:12799_t:CDS:1 n=1 Tax=Gigaspora margarita TaxID=4874 RepID=A0ABN7VZP9_GIGMA|nr:12799_t:CDS:2 [Gigaspora margarita]